MKESLKRNLPVVVLILVLLLITLFIIGDKSPINAIQQFPAKVYGHLHEWCIPKSREAHDEDFYNSNEGFLTSVWGPLVWNFLHIISFNYKVNPTQEDKENYRAFVYNLQHVLPCKYCRIGFAELLRDNPLSDEVMESRESFSRWMYTAHNIVNIRTKKPIYGSYEEVRDFYENFRARCQPTQKPQIGCVVPLYKKHKCDIKFIPQ